MMAMPSGSSSPLPPSFPPLCSNKVQTPVALRNALSQLSFESEILPDGVLENPGTVWDGLFCLGGLSDDDNHDLFFDAEQGHGTPSASTLSSLQVSGGEQHGPPSTTTFSGRLAEGQDRMNFQWGNEGPVLTEAAYEVPLDDDALAPEDSIPADVMTAELPEGFNPLECPVPPEDLPDRFLRAGKGDPVEGQRRYEATLAWRKEKGIDHILTDAHPHFDLIKKNYPHYFHLRGRNGEPIFFEQPPKTNLQAMRDGGVTLDGLLRHYAMVTEFQWQCVERDDFARSITILDLEGMGIKDFVGECIEYVRRCSEFTGQHYPERAGFVFLINVPFFFSMIWKVIQPWVDEVTLKKINIIRGKQEVFNALLEKIPIENIPPEYGGTSVPLGESPEEKFLKDMIHHNNAVANGDLSCGGRGADPPCHFCSFHLARSY